MDLETKAAPVIQSIFNTLQIPSGEDYNYLMNYLALLAVRTPTQIEQTASLMEQMAKFTMDAILEPLGARNWSVVYSPHTIGDFICSDHPVSLHWIEQKDRGIYSSPGFGRLGTEVTIPLSKRVMLLGRFDEEQMPRTIMLDSQLNLACLNSYSIIDCSRLIFSCTEDFLWYTQEEKIGTIADLRRVSKIRGE